MKSIIGIIILIGVLAYSVYYLFRKLKNAAKGSNCESCNGCPYSTTCKSNDFKGEDKK